MEGLEAQAACKGVPIGQLIEELMFLTGCDEPRAQELLMACKFELHAAVDAYLRDGRGLSLPRVSREFLSEPGGPELAVLRETGRRLVLQLALTYDNADKNPDLHCVAYDGTAVKDNNQHSKVKEVIASDRSDPASALAVLQSLFRASRCTSRTYTS